MFKKRSIVLFSALLFALVLVATWAAPAEAHCDSENGPVVAAAEEALAAGNIDLVLPYIQADDEAELTAAFEHTLKVRKLGGDARSLADRYFYEVTVRLHRAGEGAPYTGITSEEVPAAISAADRAMNSGSTKEVTRLLNEAMAHGLEEKLAAVEQARQHAKENGTVEANREKVEAELGFEIYVYQLYLAASGEAPHAEAAPAAEQH